MPSPALSPLAAVGAGRRAMPGRLPPTADQPLPAPEACDEGFHGAGDGDARATEVRQRSVGGDVAAQLVVGASSLA